MSGLLPSNGAEVAFFVGAVLGTFVISRIMLWLTRSFLGLGREGVTGGVILVAHTLTLLVTFVLAGFGFADGGSFRADAIVPYLIPWAIWLFFDGFRSERSRRQRASDE